MTAGEEARGWAEHAYLRSARTCGDAACAAYTVEEALFLCMFYLWVEEYGPGWEGAVDDVEVQTDQTAEG